MKPQQHLTINKNALEIAAQEYKQLWDARDAEVTSSYNERISKIAMMCPTEIPVSAATQGESVVQELQTALADAQVQLAAQKQAMEAADLRFQIMEAKLAALHVEVAATAPKVMSENEKT